MTDPDAQLRRTSTGMDDARRFLREITPGVALTVQVFVYWYLLDRQSAIGVVRELMKSAALGGGVAVFLACLGIGFILARAHHAVFWRWFPINHRNMLDELAGAKTPIVKFRAASGRLLKWSEVRDSLSVDAAWRVVTRLWHQRSESAQLIRGCVDRNKSLFDFMHANGAGLWGAFVAPWLAFLGLWTAKCCLNFLTMKAVCISVVVWAILLLAHFAAYMTTRSHAQAFLEGALLDGLYSSRKKDGRVLCTLAPSDLTGRPMTLCCRTYRCMVRFARRIRNWLRTREISRTRRTGRGTEHAPDTT